MERVSDLSERYRTPRSPLHRVVALLLVVGLAATSIGYVGWVYLFNSTPEVQSRLTHYDVLGPRSVVAQLNVVRESEDLRATCTLRALSEEHATVGEVDLVVERGPRTQSLRVEIRTDRPAVSVDSLGCTTENQKRPR